MLVSTWLTQQLLDVQQTHLGASCNRQNVPAGKYRTTDALDAALPHVLV
jgi:hypothetical protein